MADPTSLFSGYLKASRYSGVKSSDLSRALKVYGIELASVRKNRKVPDADLRRQATRAVVKRYQQRKQKGGSIQPLSGRG